MSWTLWSMGHAFASKWLGEDVRVAELQEDTYTKVALIIGVAIVGAGIAIAVAIVKKKN